jgi:hypothetical protein
MRAAIILMVFFLMFTVASLLIPSPMFPGNFFCTITGQAVEEYSNYLCAVFNGLFYGVIIWVVFAVLSRRLQQEK